MKLQREDSKAICDRELTMAEEMLIARAHVQMDISQVKGCQYRGRFQKLERRDRRELIYKNRYIISSKKYLQLSNIQI